MNKEIFDMKLFLLARRTGHMNTLRALNYAVEKMFEKKPEPEFTAKEKLRIILSGTNSKFVPSNYLKEIKQKELDKKVNKYFMNNYNKKD